jgi:HAD superfamily hydrolase (TIGR01509 family)
MKTESAPRTYIFDLDGTIIDSEENYYEADRQLFAGYGIDFTPAMKTRFIGTGNYEMMKQIKLEYKFTETAEELLVKKNKLYLSIAIGHTTVYPAMLRLIEILHGKGCPLAIASGTSPDVIDAFLVDCKIKQYFPVVVSAEMVERGKPAPDVFLETARRCKARPADCVVFEDAQYGVMAARSAGMRCVAIPYIIEKPLPDCFYNADLLFEDGMQSFSAEAVLTWLAKIDGYGMTPDHVRRHR